MINEYFRSFRDTPLHELISKEIDTAEKQLLEAESNVEFYRSVVVYNQERLARLKAKNVPINKK